MRIVWERECRKNSLDNRGCRLTAVMIETQGEKNTEGKRPVERLGSVEERFLQTNASDMRAFHQGLFWASVTNNLNRLKLPLESRATLEAEISIKVPKPNEEWALWGVTCIPRYDP